MAEKEEKITIGVSVRLEQSEGKDLPELMIYAFDTTGQFITKIPLPRSEQSDVKLELPSELMGTTVRVVLGPTQPKKLEKLPQWMARLIQRSEVHIKAPSLTSLYRIGGYENRYRLDEKDGTIEMTISHPRWSRWLFCACPVRGRLIKRILLPDGTNKELGVCNACVKIYEVDPIQKIIKTLPKELLLRLRSELWRMLNDSVSNPSFPIPPPDPEFWTGLKTGDLPRSNMIVHPELLSIFNATSINQIRVAMVACADVLAKYICIFDWLEYLFHSDLINCVFTDEKGRFETIIWYSCEGDKPDLYFKAVQCIGPDLYTIYDPGIICHTYWNHDCENEVILETNDPAAITCVQQDPVFSPSMISLWVMPYSIGHIRLDQLNSNGLTKLPNGSTIWNNAPFGGALGFRLGYSSGIPFDIPGKPACYRWLYNKLDDNGNETMWREFAAPVADNVVRHYIDYDLNHPELPPTFQVYLLGPKEMKNMHLYEFKPQQPSQVPGHKREWPVDDWFSDIYSGILLSHKLPGDLEKAAGKYKIKLEVFDKDANIINPNSSSFNFIVPIGIYEDGITIKTREAFASEIQDNGFVFYLHIDNNECEAEIFDTDVSGVAAGTCGFISYAPGEGVHLSFKAKHPNNFARFNFTVTRGSSGYVTSACAPYRLPDNPQVDWAKTPMVSNTSVNGFNRDSSSVFSKDVNEVAIREGCLKAAFSENLKVCATATNGESRLSGLDAYGVPKAFALEPKTK